MGGFFPHIQLPAVIAHLEYFTAGNLVMPPLRLLVD